MKLNLRNFWLVVLSNALLLACIQPVSAQMNVERLRWEGTQGFGASIDIGLSYKSGNTDVTDLACGGILGWRKDPHVTFLVGKTEYGKEGGANYLNNGQIHLRYNYLFNRLVAWEVFTQVEYDEFRFIRDRELVGSGPRFSFQLYSNLGIAIGLSAMHESESYKLRDGSDEPDQRQFRGSTYLVLNYRSEERFFINITGYVQPLFDDFTDVKYILDSTLSMKLTSHLSFGASLSLLYDTNPPRDVVKHDVALKNSLSITF